MSITVSMMDIVEEQMLKNGVERLKTLKVRVGELTAVEPEALKFCFEVCTRGTVMEGVLLDIEEVPLMGRCSECGVEFLMEGFFLPCPGCDGAEVKKISGSELEIVSMEAD
jgi:hydrogenase nickel incorporation protein HypA/HybF